MSIYTRTGDTGKTGLYGGVRVEKSDAQVEAYGCVDELSSFIGVLINQSQKTEKAFLTGIQKHLYDVMSVLAGAPVSLDELGTQTMAFEKKIDDLDKKLPKLTRFILPQGSELSVWYHVVRTVCRRAERHVSLLLKKRTLTVDHKHIKQVVMYLNRLSDMLFIMARFANKDHEVMT
ncbi:MAG: cob(I)yrinic acid a,c-diamide adenosyltransferase [Candidatus Roizmanbacteria bacterium]